MKFKIISSAWLALFTTSAFCQVETAKQVFSSPNMKTEIEKHKTVAILPFDVSVVYKRIPKNFDSSATNAEAQQLKTNLQSSMFTYLLRKGGKYTVNFQDLTRTMLTFGY